jgi:putrescine:ornithine antiporter
MRNAGVTGTKYQINLVVTLAAVLYSVYALYASGTDAVMGGMLVTALVFVIWGFIAPRFFGRTVPTGAAATA